MEIEPTWFSPWQLLEDVKKLMEVRAEGKGLSLHIKCREKLPSQIYTDATRLKQILINLVGNAIKFTESGGVSMDVDFFAKDSEQSWMQVAVVDSGIGIAEQDIAKLFMPFHQADTSTSRKFGGTGLGLAISRRLAELLGGHLTAESTLGEGSRFTLRIQAGNLRKIPMTTEDHLEKPKEAGHSAISGPRSIDGVRILLVEDGPDNQRLITFLLKKAGAQVELAKNGQEALDIFERELGPVIEGWDFRKLPFEVVLMDMQMPVMDGYEATRQLRQRGFQGPIIALTAHAMEGDREKCLNAGCTDYLTKPIDKPVMIDTIARLAASFQVI